MREGEPDLAAFGGVKAGQVCLDVGAGKGRASKPLLAAGARVVLLERDGARLAEAEAGLQGPASFVRGDARSLPFAAGTFDAVVLRAVIHHLPEPAEALREAARVARPGGAVLLVDKVGPDDVQARAKANAIERLRHSGHVWSWSERELRSLAGSARLEVEVFEPWSEERDAEEWIAGGDCAPPWIGIVRELLQADLAAGGKILGTRQGPGGALLLTQSWGSLLLRKPEARR